MLKEMWVKFWTPNVKRWIISTLVTFFAGFILAIYPSILELNLENIDNAILLGIIMAAVRAGVKAVVEGWQVYRRKDA